MRKLPHYILVLFSSMTLLSCSSLRYVEYDIVRPPQVLLPGTDPIALVYNIGESGGDTVETVPVDTMHAIFTGLLLSSIEKNYPQPIESYVMDKPTGKPVAEEQAEILSEYLGRKSIITLDRFSLQSEQKFDTLDIDWYISQRNYMTEAGITMILPDANGPMMFTVKDTMSWQGSGYSTEEAMTALPPQNETVIEALLHMSEKVSEIYLPYREKVGRIYFVSIYPLMRKADKYWKEEKYDEASYLWEYVFENTTNKALQGKAAANMAIYEELNDRYESAIMWARMAFALFCKKRNFYDSHIAYMSDYIHQLKIRVKEKSMLDKSNITENQ